MNRHDRRAAAARGRKKRQTIIKINAHVPGIEIALGPPSSDGTLEVFDAKTGKPFDGCSIETAEGYARSKGHKIIVQSPQMPGKLHTDQNRYLLEGFDHVFAVDTNTDRFRSATVVSWLHNIRLDKEGYKAELRHPPALLAEGHSSPEKNGWVYALASITKSTDLTGRIALFVDAFLAELPAINARTAPVYDDYFLPDGITLLYASADVGSNEFFGARAMRESDRVASIVLKVAPAQRMPFAFQIPAAALQQ